MTPTAPGRTAPASPEDLDELSREGIVARRGAFDVAWVDRLHSDVLAAFEEARHREGGAIGRGPQRWYVEVHPEQLDGFVDLVTHPWVTGICESALGQDYEIVEIGFDIPFPGSADQPWHRDFPSPIETHEQRRLTSLAFNISTVDTTADMGPFQIAPGTHYEAGLDWPHQMFPPRSEWPRYQEMSQLRVPQRGDISARSALTLHRGTANHSELARPVVVLGVDAPGAGHAELHDLMVTQPFWDSLPEQARRHLDARVVEMLEPIVQKHDIEGLVMGATDD
ncbi:phytanoyl-CoA dioxygenase family protein [Knoellia sp. CPCC 206453]|uniref:phytanoyl-CoA dioxygenase family protein n=1 Tax=Knoellia pratensis TaxID=3404796 RepID=UPI00361A909F